jgi:hypothetical protein
MSRVQAALAWVAGLLGIRGGDVTEPDTRAVRRLQWLLDAPLFVDESFVDKLFDAVVRPEFEVQSREVGQVSEKAHRTLFGAEVGGGYKLGLSFLTGKLDVSGKGSAQREGSNKETKSTKTVETPIVTTGRRLEEIAAVYISEHPERVVFLDTDGTATTFAGVGLSLEELERSAEDPPRILVFVAVAPNTPIMPMACELETGQTKLLYEDYTRKAFKDNPAEAPVYPADQVSSPETRITYWKALANAFSSRVAMEVIESSGIPKEGGKSERLAWIDFRMPVGSSQTIHLHCVPDGRFHTGVFGYNFVRRGFRQAVRIVGTLKAGLDVNVLALFDR